jgi:PAS domain S-box-containing protein
VQDAVVDGDFSHSPPSSPPPKENATLRTPARGQEFEPHFLKAPGSIPILFVLLWTVILVFGGQEGGHAPLLATLAIESALLFTGASLFGLSFLGKRTPSTLLLCCSVFCIACATLSSGLVLAIRGLDAEARLVLQTGMFIAAISATVSGLAALGKESSTNQGRGKPAFLVFLTIGIALLYASLGHALSTCPTSIVLMPLGPLLGLGALLLFGIASAFLLLGYRRNNVDPFYWSALALIVIAASMGVGILDSSGNDLVFWVGRVAETVGAAYFVIAGVGSLRSVSTIAETTTFDREKTVAGPNREAHQGQEDEPLVPVWEHGSSEERLLHAIIDSIPEGILVVDRAGRIVLSNPAAQAILGRPLEAGQDITARDTPGDMLNLPLICSILEEKDQRNLRMTVTWPDGRQRNLILNSAPLRNLRRELIGAVAVYHDCSRWKGKETADRFRSIVEALSDAVAVFDTDRRLLYANEPFLAGTGLKGPIEGLELREAELNPPFRTVLMEGLDTVLDSCIDHYAPCEDSASEGGVPCNFRFIPEFDETGRIAEILVIGRQTTWPTHTETVELERNEPEPLIGEQDFGTRTKNAFMANMSHELRTPLSGILGLSELTLDSELPDRVRMNVEMIHASAQELTCIVDNILDFSRLETDQMQLDLVDFDLREMMEALIRGFKDKAEAKGLELTLEMRGDLPRIIFADPYRIGQVLKNLIGNAVKFTEVGHVRVTVGKEGEDSDSLFLVFVVMDTGIGIPHHLRRNVFNEFKQLDSGYGKQHAGIGLGLALSRQLAELMGGSIDFQSTVGKGSTFVFRTRMRRRVLHEPPENDRIKADSILALLPEMSILLVEDNRVNQLFLSKLLTRAGHAPEIAGNGIDALRALERTRFDLVLMDIQMPEMDGVEATRAIRNSQGAKIDRTVPIIGLTAFAMHGDRERFMAVGMDGYVPKPVNLEELALEIRRVIRKKDGRGSLLPHEQRM